MKVYTYEEAQAAIVRQVQSRFGPLGIDSDTDNKGQIVIHTHMYKWTDGSIRDEPDPLWWW